MKEKSNGTNVNLEKTLLNINESLFNLNSSIKKIAEDNQEFKTYFSGANSSQVQVNSPQQKRKTQETSSSSSDESDDSGSEAICNFFFW